MPLRGTRELATKKRNIMKLFWLIPAMVFLVKLIIISNISGGAWLGADGESYINGVNALITEGLYSTAGVLHYWPAGYPIIILFAHSLSPTATLATLSLIQSALYAVSTGYFAFQLNKTSLKQYSMPSLILLSANPTLNLNTLSVGYEVLSASCFVLVAGLFISSAISKNRKFFSWQVLLSALILSLNGFVQPRFILSSIIIFLLWGLFLFPRRSVPLVTLLGISLSLALPLTLIYRNAEANGFATISTNLGKTMQIGAGKGATGAYDPTFGGVDCPPAEGNPAQLDRALVDCVLNWYVENPLDSLRLFINKSQYFWSPWYGPLATGSMARNPGNLLNPAYWLASSSQDRTGFVYGKLGQILSAVWMLGIFLLLIFGLVTLWRLDKLARQVSLMLASILLANWLISIGSLGDHRQRLPVQGVVVYLQAVAITSLTSSLKLMGKKRKTKNT